MTKIIVGRKLFIFALKDLFIQSLGGCILEVLGPVIFASIFKLFISSGLPQMKRKNAILVASLINLFQTVVGANRWIEERFFSVIFTLKFKKLPKFAIKKS